jgi:hypothetical protein
LRLITWFGLGSRKVYRDFEVGVNYNYAEFKFDQAKTQVLKLGLPNTVKASFGNEKLFKNFGFNVVIDTYTLWHLHGRWYIDAATVIDAQIMNFQIKINA